MSRFMKTVHDDAGMTLVEIMVATVILFIVMTAMLGLVAQTTNTSMLAKQKTVMTNAVNAYVERVQALPFATVGIAGEDTSGTLNATETIDAGGYTVTIVSSVSPGDTDTLKVLALDVTLSGPRVREQQMETEVIIRDRLAYVTQGLRSPATDPTIVWNAGIMAPYSSVVWAAQTASNGALRIAADITASEGRTIRLVEIRTDHGDLLRDTGNLQAAWTPGVQTWSVPYFIWNTLQEELVDVNGTEMMVPVVADGLRVLTITAEDSDGVRISKSWQFVVDNSNPGAPGVPEITAQAGTTTTFGWTLSADGTDGIDHYQLVPYRQNMTYWSEETAVLVPAPPGVVPTVPFGRYWLHMRAVGPVPNARVSDFVAIATPWVTRPRVQATATVSKSGNNYTTVVNCSCSTPSFPVEGAVIYQWQRSTTGVEGTWVNQVGTTSTLTQSVAGPASKQAAILYYRCIVTYTPDGYAGGTLESKTSNKAGPTGFTSGALTEVW